MVENLKLNKKSLQYLGIIIIIAIIVCIGFFYYLKWTGIEERQEEGPILEEGISEETLKQFRSSNEEGIEIPEHELEQFGASDERKEISEDVLEQFRAQ